MFLGVLVFFFFNLFQDNFKSLKGSIRKGDVSITNICYKEANFTLTVKKKKVSN